MENKTTELTLYGIAHEIDLDNQKTTLLTTSRVRSELKAHDASWDEFVSEYGYHHDYQASNLLEFLGY